MAPRRGELTQEPTLAGLQFDEPLSWRAGKAIPTGTLLQRLDTLSNELREMDQEETDKGSLTAVAKELVGPNLLNHKDKGVRAFTACCLVDILKLCAPDAPFTGTQLKVPCSLESELYVANCYRIFLLFSSFRYYLRSQTPLMPTTRNINMS